MYFSQITTLSAIFLAIGALATPAKRDLDSDVDAVLEILSTTTSATLAEICRYPSSVFCLRH